MHSDHRLYLLRPYLRLSIYLLLPRSKDASLYLLEGLSTDFLESFLLEFIDYCLPSSIDLFLLNTRSLEEGLW